MARFLVKASEFKNVCKAVNDRKLAELKKEIIEILKKQDENEVKKAVDYFNSQELHYTHLEKSLVSGRWIEKAGYGVGTVRIWKGKKYKKIAPGKWARVFDKEGRGTNIAIGKLIAKVNKIDNAEDLLQFVMENKQRFVDEDGKELSIINKVRAAVDARNETLSGESKPYVYGVGEEVSAAKNEMFSKKDKISKEEADLHKISRKYSQIPTTELKQRKAKLDRWIENKTRNKREHLNNAIFKERYQEEVDAINKELEKRNKGTADNKVLDKYKTDAENMTTEQLEYYVEDLKNGTGNIGKENLEERKKIYGDELNKRKGTAEKKTESSKKIEVELLSKEEMKKMTGDKLADYRHKLHEEMKKFDYGDDENFDKVYEVKKIADDIFRNKEFARNEEPKEDKVSPKISEGDYVNIKEEWRDKNEKNYTYYVKEVYEDQGKALITAVNGKTAIPVSETVGLDMIEHSPNADSFKEREKFAEKESDADRLKRRAEDNYGDWSKKDLESELESLKEKAKEGFNVDDDREQIEYILENKDFDEEESEAEKHQNRSDAMKGNKNAYKGGPKDVAKYINSQTNDDKERNSMLVEAFNERYGTETDKDYAFYSMGELYNDVVQAKPHTDKWYDAMNKYDEAAEMYKMVIGDDEIDYYNREVEKIRMKPNWNKEKLSDSNKNSYKGGKAATSNPEKLKPIAKSESIEEGKVKIPYSKEIADEIKQLTNSVAKIKLSDTRYAMMNKVYYDKGNLVATDGKCMKIIKVGELSGIDNGTYVDIDNSKDGITITADKEFTKEYKFPQYERVLPQDNKEKIVLDNKALISKIKDLKKDGSISNKDSFVTFDIQGNDLMLDGVKVGDVSAANFEGEDSNYFNIDSNLLTKYLSGDYSELMSSKDNSKAMYLGNDSAINIIMPQTKYEYKYDSSGNQKRESRRKDYDSRRKDKEFADEAKSNKKAAQKMANQGYVDDVINGYKRTVPADFEEKSIKKIQDWDLGTLQNMYKIANADIDHLMETKDLQSNSFMSFTNKEFGCSPRHVIGQNYAMKEHPAIVREIERLIKEKGGKIEKSLFDDFIMDVFAADDEEELEEELYAGETEYNDYSAEQPELFNSTAMKVREAMDRIRNQVL